MTAACLSGVVLGSFMCFLVVLCRVWGRNPGPLNPFILLPTIPAHLFFPDNIAPAIASCLGDLVTLIFIGLVSMALINFLHTPIPLILGCIVIAFAIFCGVYMRRNKHVRDLIFQGWAPLFGAMIISSATGIILNLFVSRYEGFALMAVVISGTTHFPSSSSSQLMRKRVAGLPGGVGSILVSRLSTSLHAAALSTSSRPPAGTVEASPRLVMITLLLVTLPVEVVFLAILHSMGWLRLPWTFIGLSVVFFCCAVSPVFFLPLIVILTTLRCRFRSHWSSPAY